MIGRKTRLPQNNQSSSLKYGELAKTSACVRQELKKQYLRRSEATQTRSVEAILPIMRVWT